MNWWTNYPWRMIQTNLRETDMEDINAEEYAKDLADFGATVVLLNAAGIIASYDTKLDFQTKSAYLHADSLSQIIDACHKRGIKVIARTDFSKVRYELYEKHPEWAYRTKDGNIVSYNGDVHVCPNGDYQQKYMFEILKEVLGRSSRTFPVRRRLLQHVRFSCSGLQRKLLRSLPLRELSKEVQGAVRTRDSGQR